MTRLYIRVLWGKLTAICRHFFVRSWRHAIFFFVLIDCCGSNLNVGSRFQKKNVYSTFTRTCLVSNVSKNFTKIVLMVWYTRWADHIGTLFCYRISFLSALHTVIKISVMLVIIASIYVNSMSTFFHS